MVWCGQWKVRGQTESRRNPRTSSQVAAAVSGDGDMSRGWQAPSLKAKSDDRLAKEFEKRTDHYKQDGTTTGDFAIYFFSPSLLSEENNSLKELAPRSIFLSGLLFLAVWFIVVGRERIPNPETLLFILGLRLAWAVGVERVICAHHRWWEGLASRVQEQMTYNQQAQGSASHFSGFPLHDEF